MADENTNTAIAPTDNNLNFGMSTYTSDDVFDSLVRSSFLPRVQLCGGSSEIVKEGKMQVGRYALIRNKDDFVDLGEATELVPLAYRLLAMRFGQGKVESYYDPQSPEFKQVQQESGEEGGRAAYGVQFLVWVPSLKEVATYFFGSNSARPEARKVKTRMGLPITCKSRLVRGTKGIWHVPVVIPYNGEVSLPTRESLQAIVDQFNNPAPSSVEEEFKPQEGGAQQPAATAGGRPR